MEAHKIRGRIKNLGGSENPSFEPTVLWARLTCVSYL
jgi:hypothetical protein